MPQLAPRESANCRRIDLGPVFLSRLDRGETLDLLVEQHIDGSGILAILGRIRERMQRHEVPGVVEESTLERVADTDPDGSDDLLFGEPDRLGNLFDFAKQATLGADVPQRPPRLAQGLAVSTIAFAVTGDAIDEKDIGGDVLFDVIADVILNRITAIDVGANFGKDFVPRPADLRIEITSQRAEVFVEVFATVVPARPNALAPWRAVLTVVLQLFGIPFGFDPSTAFVPGSFDDHFRHVGTHRKPRGRLIFPLD